VLWLIFWVAVAAIALIVAKQIERHEQGFAKGPIVTPAPKPEPLLPNAPSTRSSTQSSPSV
jgi:hypothetical protein